MAEPTTERSGVKIDLKPMTKWELRVENLGNPLTNADLYGMVRDAHKIKGASVMPIQSGVEIGNFDLSKANALQLGHQTRETGSSELSSIRFFNDKIAIGGVEIRPENRDYVVHQIFPNSDITHPVDLSDETRRELAKKVLGVTSDRSK